MANNKPNIPCGSGEYVHDCDSVADYRQSRQKEACLLGCIRNDPLAPHDRFLFHLRRTARKYFYASVLPVLRFLLCDFHQRSGLRSPLGDVSEQRKRYSDVYSRSCSLDRNLPRRSAHSMAPCERSSIRPGRHLLPLRPDVYSLPSDYVEVSPGNHRQIPRRNRTLLDETVIRTILVHTIKNQIPPNQSIRRDFLCPKPGSNRHVF